MLGREAYHRPACWPNCSRRLYPAARPGPGSRAALLERMAHYAEREIARGERLSAITRHMLGLYGGRARSARVSAHAQRGTRAAAVPARRELLRQAIPPLQLR